MCTVHTAMMYTCHGAVARSDREKSYLHKKLQTVQKYPSSRLRTPTTLTNTDDVQSMNQVEELKRQIHQLEEEVCVCVF